MFAIFTERLRDINNRYLQVVGLAVRVVANGPEDLGSIPGRVIPMTQKNGTWCLLA